MYQIKHENKIAFILALIASLCLTFMFVYAVANGQGITQDIALQMASGKMCSEEKPQVKIIYTFTLKHYFDNTDLPVNLVSFIDAQCKDLPQIGLVCYDGYTEQKSDHARKNDPEHPVDTKEVINLVYLGGKPEIKMSEFMHEVNHAVQYHWISRTYCENNYRYTECMEKMGYDQGKLYLQMVELSRKNKVKIRFYE